MTIAQAVPAEGETYMAAEAPLQHQCPFVRETDHGTVRIEWITEGHTIELHSLRAYLDTFADMAISHEDLTYYLRLNLAQLDGLTITSITTTWNTAGVGVTCSTSPTHAGTQ